MENLKAILAALSEPDMIVFWGILFGVPTILYFIFNNL